MASSPLTIPSVRWSDVGLLAGALGIALVSLADTISTASAFGGPYRRRSAATAR